MNNLNIITDDFSGQTLIEASAGTGKTYTLALLYVRLLLEKKLTVRQILVVTFTKAATAELRTRIRKFLADLLSLYDNFAANNAAIDINLIKLHDKFSKAEYKNRLSLAVHGFDEAAIYTIHGFCQRALAESAFEASSDFSSELIDNDQEIITNMVFDLWRIKSADFSYLWACFLLKNKISPNKIYKDLKNYIGKFYLQVTTPINSDQQNFKNKTNLKIHNWDLARNLWLMRSSIWQQKLMEFSGFNKGKITPDKLTKWFLAVDNLFANKNPSFNNLSELGKIASDNITQAINKGNTAPQDELADVLQQLFDELSVINEQFSEYLAEFKANFLAEINAQLPQIKAQKRVLAFDDLINQLSDALNGDNSEILAKSLREKFPLALIDEFQDTDPAQYQIFSTIYPPNCGASLCLVGDPKQAIYAFRSADFATYIKARSKISKRYSLITNYRTSDKLINSLNYLFAGKSPFADSNLQYFQAKSANLPRKTLVLPDNLGKSCCNLIRLSENYFKNSADARNLAAEHIAVTINNILNASLQGTAYFVDENNNKTPIQNHDFAILVGSHDQARLISEYLSKYHINWLRKDKDNVFSSSEAEQFLSVLNAYLNPHNESLLRYALSSDLLGKNSADLQNLNHNTLLFEQEFNTACKYLDLWQKRGFLFMFRIFLAEQQVAPRLLQLTNGERRLTNLLHLAQILGQQSITEKTPEALFLWFVNQCNEQNISSTNYEMRLESDANRVVISTIHSAKGLEYNLVFCPFLWCAKSIKSNEPVRFHNENDDQLVDFSQQNANYQLAKQENFTEQMRLLYVALTRAKERLWLYWAVTEKSATNSKSTTGLHSSSLGWLLHGRNLTADNPLSDLRTQIKQQNIESLNQQLSDLAQNSLGALTLCNPDLDTPNEINQLQNFPKLTKAVFTRELKPSFKISSFSQITKHTSHLLPIGETSGIFAFPKGANAGNCLHQMLEDWVKGKTLDLAYVTQILTIYNFDPNEWANIIYEHLQKIINTKLTGNLSLNNINPEQRFAELDFTFSLNNFNHKKLIGLLTNSKYQLQAAFMQNCKLLDFAEITGFMRGLIDLVFCYDDKWFIADYKSNWLGFDASFYEQNNLLEAIGREHYYLQYLIYSIALKRFLRSRGLEHKFGGVYYLFIRAMPDAGIYFDKPNELLLNDLDNLFNSYN